METMDIREKLVSIRESKGYSKRTVSEMTGIPYTTYIKYESGERKEVSMQALCKLADFYGVTTDYLLGREKPAEQVPPILQITNEEMERQLLEAYFSLPEKLRKQFLDGMAEKLQKQKGVGAVPQEQKPTQMTAVKSVDLYADYADSDEDSAQTA